MDFVYIYFSAFDTSFGKLLNYLFLKTYQKILQEQLWEVSSPIWVFIH